MFCPHTGPAFVERHPSNSPCDSLATSSHRSAESLSVLSVILSVRARLSHRSRYGRILSAPLFVLRVCMLPVAPQAGGSPDTGRYVDWMLGGYGENSDGGARMLGVLAPPGTPIRIGLVHPCCLPVHVSQRRVHRTKKCRVALRPYPHVRQRPRGQACQQRAEIHADMRSPSTRCGILILVSPSVGPS